MSDLEHGPNKEHSMMRWVVRRTYWLVAVTVVATLAGDALDVIEASGAIISTAFLALGAVVGAKSYQRGVEK